VHSSDILLFHIVYGNGNGRKWEYHRGNWEGMGTKCKNYDITGMGMGMNESMGMGGNGNT